MSNFEPLDIVDDRTPEQLRADGDEYWPDGTLYVPPSRPSPLETLGEKVRVGLFLRAVCLSVSSSSNRWGRTLRAKILTPAEARELAEVLRFAADEAEVSKSS